MHSKKAGELFHKKKGYNCGQAILKAFQDVFDITDQQIEEFSAFGGGRAEDGVCGALHAARSLIKDEEKRKILDQKFLDMAGSLKCKEIRKLKRLDCKGCVQTVASILDTL